MSKIHDCRSWLQISDFRIDHKIPLFWYCVQLSSAVKFAKQFDLDSPVRERICPPEKIAFFGSQEFTLGFVDDYYRQPFLFAL